MLDDLFKRTEHLVQQSVERMLKQILKPFKRAFTLMILFVPAKKSHFHDCGRELALLS